MGLFSKKCNCFFLKKGFSRSSTNVETLGESFVYFLERDMEKRGRRGEGEEAWGDSGEE